MSAPASFCVRCGIEIKPGGDYFRDEEGGHICGSCALFTVISFSDQGPVYFVELSAQ